jgi:endonuclease/exonuclease/phosphatase (EEP) superfamily protein YafD
MIRFFALRPVLILALLLLAVGGIVPPADAADRVIVHYQKNMSFKHKRERALANDIIQRNPDTVSLQEVNRDNTKILDMLAPAFPSQHFCRFPEIGGVAVLSRWPMIEGSARCLRGQGVTAIQVRMPEGPVWVMSVHLETPDKPLHDRMVGDLGPEIAALRGPKVIGGDFNALPLSNSVLSLARSAGANRIGQSVTTYRLNPLVGVPIDHVLASGGRGQITQLPLIGSDHYGVLAEFTLEF